MSGRGEPYSWQFLLIYDDDGSVNLAKTRAGFPATDREAARLLGEEWRDLMHYALPSKTWYIWDGRCHAPHLPGEPAKIVMELGERMQYALKYLCDNLVGLQNWPAWAGCEKYARGLAMTRGWSSLVTTLAEITGCTDEDMSERHPELLNVANGTINLRTGLVKPHDPADMITHCLPVAYDRNARCPEFWGMICTMTGEDHPGVALYVATLLGYSVLGDNRDQKIIFISGETGLGKTTVLGIVSQVLGPLAHPSNSGLICYVRHGRNARVENSIRGKRLITITETSAWMNIEEAQVKRLTGEHRVATDQHYAREEDRTPITWTIWLGTNQMPSLANFDEAMRRRVLVIPCGRGLPAWMMDKEKEARVLARERAGILALLVAGAMRYFREGLDSPPGEVLEATERYAIEQDTVMAFAADKLTVHAGAAISQAQLWNSYKEWSKGGQAHLGRNEFYDRLRRHPDLRYNPVMRRFEGMGWKPEDWASSL